MPPSSRLAHSARRDRSSRRNRSPLMLFLLLLLWSVVLGIGLAQAITPPANGTVDPVPAEHQLGQELYLENCATCHVGVPPAVMPAETWRQLLPDPEHYGVQITPLGEPQITLVWNYLRLFSRDQEPDEAVPYRVEQSRYFKILHPRVDLPRGLTLNSCVSCHPAAAQFNYRSLSPEWEDAP